MFRIGAYLLTSIGQKKLMGISGILLSGFLLTHMAGNLLILCGPESYNMYSHKLITNPLLPIAELGLVGLFAMHLLLAVKLTRENRAARGGLGYAVAARGEKAVCPASKTMILSGLVIFAFTVLHLKMFKYGAHYTASYGGTEVRDLYKLVVEELKQPLWAGWYGLSLLLLGAHLSHGIGATFQSLGLASARSCTVVCASRAIAALIATGFVVQTAYVYFFI